MLSLTRFRISYDRSFCFVYFDIPPKSGRAGRLPVLPRNSENPPYTSRLPLGILIIAQVTLLIYHWLTDLNNLHPLGELLSNHHLNTRAVVDGFTSQSYFSTRYDANVCMDTGPMLTHHVARSCSYGGSSLHTGSPIRYLKYITDIQLTRCSTNVTGMKHAAMPPRSELPAPIPSLLKNVRAYAPISFRVI